ncbi:MULTISPECIES: N-acetylglucosamine kinase [unclassified Duganella]|jgi:N-acetylglucosamine kinase-like BadF-type ATPase|uniref:N-acetylglucosamine kinase n=1 Tax=unclassified Duganella TaxID=2636909 RepID=UPI00088A3A6B|nr:MULTISPECIES: BadF/BadG/BcrA/BcrD ATPase family protein [unclassified Duganella]SDG38825.1 BadF-type ATPase [Duganella sp. OV458]SDJ64943.1 BadF-type ATPase [Duganella sp. OV510]
MFLGVDGGGTKTAFALIDSAGRVLARHQESSAYYLEVGMAGVAAMLTRGYDAVCAAAGATTPDIRFAFFGLPAYGEDRVVQPQLDALPRAVLGHDRYLCGNDMVCSWAGSLACADGISVIAGTGSMAYGEFGGKQARAGGWGELFSDEGSAHWIARAGLRLFSRMSDGRAPRGPLYQLVRERLALQQDLDLCQVVYGELNAERSRIAALSRLVSEAAAQGDAQALAIIDAAAEELAALVDAVRSALGVAAGQGVAVSYTGGLFGVDGPLHVPFADALAARGSSYRLAPPKLAPVLGAALYAARAGGTPLSAAALEYLAVQQ